MAFVKGQFDVTQYIDTNGDPATGYILKFFLTGTTTPTAIYFDSAGSASATSVTLNTAGRWTNGGTEVDLFFDVSVTYKAQLYLSDGTTTVGPTIDPFYPDSSENTQFLQSGSGAIARTVQEKLRDVVSVLDFGAADDGTDYSTEIQNAIDASSAVVVPAGKTFLCKELTLKSNFTLIVNGTLKIPDNTGSGGANATIINMGGASKPSYNSDGIGSGYEFTNIKVIGTGTFDGNCGNLPDRFNSGGTVQFYGHLCTFGSVDGLRIGGGLKFLNASGFAVAVNECRDVTIDGYTINSGPGNEGNSNFFNGRNQDGIHFVNVQDFTICNGEIESGDDAINIASDDTTLSNARTRNGRVFSNTLRQNMGTGNRDATSNNYRVLAFGFKIDPAGGSICENIKVWGNDIDGRDNGAKAISIGAGNASGRNVKNVRVWGNNIFNFDGLGATGYVPDFLLRFIECEDVIYSGNIHDNFARLIDIQNVDGLKIDGRNIFKDQVANSTQNSDNKLFNLNRGNGIADNVTITDNVFLRMLGGIVSGTTTTNTADNFIFTKNEVTTCAYGNTDNANVVTYSVVNIADPGEIDLSGNIIRDHAATLYNITSIASGAVITCDDGRYYNTGNGVAALNAEIMQAKTPVGTSVLGRVSFNRNKAYDSQGLMLDLQNIKELFICDNESRDIDQKNNTDVMFISYAGSSSDLVTTGVAGVISGNRGTQSNTLSSGAIRIRTEQLVSSTWSGTVLQAQLNHHQNSAAALTYQAGTNGESTAGNVVSETVPTSPSSTNTLLA